MYSLYTLNLVLAIGGLSLLAVTIGLFVDYFCYRSKYFLRWGKQFVWEAILLTTIGSVVLSLVYSEYYGFVPCSLCWLQRIALFPQVLMAGVAFRMKENVHFPLYGIALSLFGLGVAVYHYVYQMFPKEAVGGVMPCLADGSADCATKVIDQFGFVTFPFLTAVAFAFLIALYLNLRRSSN